MHAQEPDVYEDDIGRNTKPRNRATVSTTEWRNCLVQSFDVHALRKYKTSPGVPERMGDLSTHLRNLRLVSEPITDERVTRVIRILDDLATNGGCRYCQFLIEDVESDTTSTLTRFLDRGVTEFYGWVLTSDALNDAVDELNTSDGFEYGSPTFDWYHSLFIDGYVGWLVVRGGAYTYNSFGGSETEAKALGRDFVEGTFSERYDDIRRVKRCQDQWSDWFRGVDHWDETLLFVDLAENRLWLLLFSDTD